MSQNLPSEMECFGDIWLLGCFYHPINKPFSFAAKFGCVIGASKFAVRIKSFSPKRVVNADRVASRLNPVDELPAKYFQS